VVSPCALLPGVNLETRKLVLSGKSVQPRRRFRIEVGQLVKVKSCGPTLMGLFGIPVVVTACCTVSSVTGGA